MMDWQMVAPGKDREQANVYINILKSYKGLERQYRIMLEAIKMLGYYKYEPDPGVPPYVYENWITKKDQVNAMPADKKAEYWKRLMLNKEAKEYFDACQEVLIKNLSNVQFLCDMLYILREAKDEVNYPKVLAIYNKYPTKIGQWKRKLFPATLE